MEGREGHPPVESALHGLSQEQRIRLAEACIKRYEELIESSAELAKNVAALCEERIKERGTGITLDDVRFEVMNVAAESAQNWYEWIKKELLMFEKNDIRQALNRLGISESEEEVILHGTTE
ncbi:MAG: hypothetical protein JNM83_12435 [Myxococcales bacterium]|jgi:hypothetical protein|nr:hypothetical protein [Myxococcales bacterium]